MGTLSSPYIAQDSWHLASTKFLPTRTCLTCQNFLQPEVGRRIMENSSRSLHSLLSLIGTYHFGSDPSGSPIRFLGLLLPTKETSWRLPGATQCPCCCVQLMPASSLASFQAWQLINQPLPLYDHSYSDWWNYWFDRLQCPIPLPSDRLLVAGRRVTIKKKKKKLLPLKMSCCVMNAIIVQVDKHNIEMSRMRVLHACCTHIIRIFFLKK